MPKVNRSVETLRERFPRLDIAVVSHGQEMLALQSNRREHDQKAHDLAQRLTKQQGVPVYVCETFAAAKQLLLRPRNSLHLRRRLHSEHVLDRRIVSRGGAGAADDANGL
jgi:hypothetical protein